MMDLNDFQCNLNLIVNLFTTLVFLFNFDSVTPSTKIRSTIVVEAAAGILATNNPDIREVYPAEIVEMSTNCSETSLSMSDLFEGEIRKSIKFLIKTLLHIL